MNLLKISFVLYLLSFSAAFAQNIDAIEETSRGNTTPKENSGTTLPETRTPNSASSNIEEKQKPNSREYEEKTKPLNSNAPINFTGLGNNQMLLSALNSHSDLKAILGEKIEDSEAKLFRSRFEKYLNAPPADSKEDREYNQLLIDISNRLTGQGGGSELVRTIDAWKMLFKAEEYPMDGQLCRTIADKIINFWQTTKKTERLLEENEKLERDRARKESSMISVQTRDRREFIEIMRGKDSTPPPTREYELDPLRKRLLETEKKIEENKSYEITSRLNQKLDFQSLIVQFFVQRRYYHAMIANDFYRYIFVAEDGKLDGVESLKTQVFGGLDLKLTTSTIDALCKEAINDTNESIKATEYLISRGEIHSATNRLIEAFFIGENLASVKTFPLEKKREILRYMRDTDKLINAVKVKHVERAETILKDITSYVSDFDSGQIEAFIQSSKQLSDLALQKALVAAQTNNQKGIESALQESVEFWPTNPKIQEFLKDILGKADLKDIATNDFDRLVKQKDFRAIFNDRFRFAAALANDQSRNMEFLEIMKRMETIETSMAQARELLRLNNPYAAWEVLENVYRKFPEDIELSRLRSDLTVKASSLATALYTAEESKAKGDTWIALINYIRAYKIYPMSTISNDNISVLAKKILEEKKGGKSE